MEESSLYNPGFLGSGGFHWWVGQIASDDTWRDNMLSGKYARKDQTPGWGRRYKVRIIGLHDREETTIPSDQLPWAQVMYPITGGGGQSNAGATSQLRQGNFVFGFFLDGQEQQVPVIMGVLGSNVQTQLATRIGTTNTNYSSTSGYATPASGNKDPNIKVPDEGLTVDRSEGVTKENVDAVHQQSNADTKRNDLYLKKTVLVNICDFPGSAIKAIQTIIDELSKEIDKILQAAQNYIDAVSTVISDVQRLISNAACEIAKYMKVLFDKLMEFILKTTNKSLAPTVDLLQPNQRNQYFDIKNTFTEIITCIFNNILNSLCGQIQQQLEESINIKDTYPSNGSEAEEFTRNKSNASGYTTDTPICSVETLIAKVVSQNSQTITNSVDSFLTNVNDFLSDIQKALGEAGQFLSSINQIISGISSSISAALNFINTKPTFFGCDLLPDCAVSDYYQIQSGGAAATECNIPLLSNIDASLPKFSGISAPSFNDVDFATPFSNQIDLKLC
jgi:hypothetical protein